MGAILVQIAILDIVFSLDSVITAVGMADEVGVMITAIIIAVGVMMFCAQAIGEFVENNPTIKMLALSFLILVGTALLGEGMHFHIPKGYIYFAMAFAVVVEVENTNKKHGKRHQIDGQQFARKRRRRTTVGGIAFQIVRRLLPTVACCALNGPL